MPRIRGFRDPKEIDRLGREVAALGFRIEFGVNNKWKTWTALPPSSNVEGLVAWGHRSRLRHQRKPKLDDPPTPLQGWTVGVKDNIVTTSLPSSCASNILRGHVAPQKATVVELMENAGMAIAGKTNMDEFGMGSHNLNSAFGAMAQPYTKQSVGGSSGGSALAVAMQDCHLAIGTDTGGSVRLPAAYLNLCGFKPSYGMISRYGVVPYANSLDTVGILSRRPIDVFLLFDVLAQPDSRDPTCLTKASRKRIDDTRTARLVAKRKDPIRVVADQSHYSERYSAGDLRADLRPDVTQDHRPNVISGIYKDFSGARTIGIPTEYNIAELQPDVLQAWKTTIATLRAQGHTILPINLPTTPSALSAYYILAPAEASSNLAKYDGIRYGPVRTPTSATSDNGVLYSAHRGALFGDEVKRRILMGSFSLSASSVDNYFLQAQRVRRLVQNDFNQVFRMAHPLLPNATGVENGVDFILCPTAPSFPPDVYKLKDTSPPESYMNDVFTVPASLAGLPAMSVPAPPPPGKRVPDTQRAVGMQVIGQYGDDLGVIHFVNRSLWASTQWAGARPGNAPEAPRMR